MNCCKGVQRPCGETEAERTLRKRREAEKKVPTTMVDSRSARHQSRSSVATDDGLGDAVASGKRKDASSTPHDSSDKLPKRGSKRMRRSDASLQSSSEKDEESVTGAVNAEKSKFARHTGLQSVQVKSFEIHFLIFLSFNSRFFAA